MKGEDARVAWSMSACGLNRKHLLKNTNPRTQMHSLVGVFWCFFFFHLAAADTTLAAHHLPYILQHEQGRSSSSLRMLGACVLRTRTSAQGGSPLYPWRQERNQAGGKEQTKKKNQTDYSVGKPINLSPSCLTMPCTPARALCTRFGSA